MSTFSITNTLASLDVGALNVGSSDTKMLKSSSHVRDKYTIGESTTLTQAHSGNIIITTNNSSIFTLPPASISKGYNYNFMIDTNVTACKWRCSDNNLIYGSINGGGTIIGKNGVTNIEIGTLYGQNADAMPGDKIQFWCDGEKWFVTGMCQLLSAQVPTFNMIVYSEIDNGVDLNNVLNHKDNITIKTEDASGWNWNASKAQTLMGITPPNLNFMSLGTDPDPSVNPINSNDGTTYNSQVMAFYDPLAPSYTGKTKIRVIDLQPFDTIIQSNIGNTIPLISYSQIQTSRPTSITIVFKVGDNSNGGNRPDIETNVKYGRLTASEDLYIEFFDNNHTSMPTPTSTEYTNDTHYSSHLESLWNAKEPLHYSQVTYATLQNSPMYLYMRDHMNTPANHCIPVSPYWHQGTSTVLNTLSSASGWNSIPTIAQGGDGINTFYDLVYGSAISNSFIYNGPNSDELSGIYGAADNGISPLWDNSLALDSQTTATYNTNASLVPNANSKYNSTSIISSKHGNQGRSLNLPSGDWQSKTINIPEGCVTMRIFQDRYTSGGNSNPNDNYAIGSIKINFTGTYTL